MAQPKIFVTRIIPQAGVELLSGHANVEVNDSDVPLTPGQLQAKASAVDALLTLLTDKIDREVLAHGSALKVVSNVAVGYDNIDIPAATELGIVVTNTPGVLTDTTADFAWTLLMTVARRVVEGDAFLRAGKYQGWGIQMLLGGDVHGATLGLVGMGRIGQAMARRAKGFDMTVKYYDEFRLPEEREQELGVRFLDLDSVFRESDFVSIHTPLTPETRHLVNADRLRSMKRTAYLINTARGPIIDEAALAQALKEGVIAGAALDVYEEEPDVNADLIALPNVVVTPHIASASVATRTRMATMAAENCLAVLNDRKPNNPVNPEVLDSERLIHRMSAWA